METNLLPCPFCGGEAELLIEKINSELIVEEVRCVDCFVSRSWRERPNNNLHRAITAWNTRYQKECKPECRDSSDGFYSYYCPNCGEFMGIYPEQDNYCYNCGVKFKH